MAQFPNSDQADGIWTLKKVRRAILGENWPLELKADQFFDSTVLLLNADGASDGGQNNTFLDSSSNAHTITRNGNVTQGSFSPFSVDEGKWGVRFSPSSLGVGGAENNIRDPNFTALQANPFTIEFWINFDNPANGNYEAIFTQDYNGTGEIRLYKWNTGSVLSFYSPNHTDVQGTTVLQGNRWYHIAVVHIPTQTNLTVYIDGVADIEITNYSDTLNSTVDFGIGSGGTNTSDTTYPFEGYISNFRVINGTAVYTSSFTPPTEPLTAITNTQLLTCQSNRFKDNSTNNQSLEISGTVKVVPFSPFPQIAPYNASQNGASGYFDGDGDYLQMADSDAFYFDGDFTLEAWIYQKEQTGLDVFMVQWAGGASRNVEFEVRSGQLSLYMNRGGTNYQAVGGTITTGQWYHVAGTLNGTTLSVFINGQSVGSTTVGNTANNSAAPMEIGANGGSYPFNGYVSNARIVKGAALYTSAFTPPTAPLTEVSGTSLLCNFTNASIVDVTGRNVLETVGNAQVDTTTVKYGTGAMEFDGTGDWLISPASEQFNFGTGDFTIEGWINFASGLGDSFPVVLNNNANYSNTTGAFLVQIYPGDVLNFGWYDGGTSDIQGSTDIGDGAYHHFAVVRSGTTITVYVDGVSDGSATSSAQIGTSNTEMFVGRYIGVGGNLYAYNGFIDDLRITKGIARYTANFTPPTAELPVIGE